MRLTFASVAGLGMAFGLAAAPLPAPIVPQGVGVNIHFHRGHETDLDQIAAAGFKVARVDLGWDGIERSKGQYDWSACDELTTNLVRRGLRALYILDYSNPLYEETVVTRDPVSGRVQRDLASPQHPGSVAAFAQWSAAAAKRYRDQHVIWELWNEPNITFWKPKPDVAQYNALALAACRAIRAADPSATIIGPATSEVPLAFLSNHLASGVLEYLDAVSVHPYRSDKKPPETAGEDYRNVRELISKLAPPGKRNLPIVSGEWGYSSFTRGVTAETQGAYAARQQLANLLYGVPISIWYDWQDDGPDSTEREHRFGLVTQQLEPKPAYLSIRTLTTELTGYRLERRLSVGGADDFVLLFSRPRSVPKLAVWTTGERHAVSIPITHGTQATVHGVNLHGATVGVQTEASGSRNALTITATGPGGQSIGLDANRLTVDLDPDPLYLALTGVRLAR